MGRQSPAVARSLNRNQEDSSAQHCYTSAFPWQRRTARLPKRVADLRAGRAAAPRQRRWRLRAALRAPAGRGPCPERALASGTGRESAPRTGTAAPAVPLRPCGKASAVRGKRPGPRTAARRRSGELPAAAGQGRPRGRHPGPGTGGARGCRGRAGTPRCRPARCRALRGNPRRGGGGGGRARALRPHCVVAAAWPSARGAPRRGALAAGRGGVAAVWSAYL